ncbi:MAG: T9SS type A sorting domain-containing protein [Phycisphaerales bacterium]|nr:T9SS type A sorting domain-containing protein [Phycisphaerales bacterium]
MKKLMFFLMSTLCVVNVFAQKETTSFEVLGRTFNTNHYYTITKQLDSIWEANPKRFDKGSGFKLYQRWKEYWKYYLKADGTLMNADEIANEFKNARKIQIPKTILAKTTGIDNSDWRPLGPYSHKNKGSWSSGQGRVNVTVVDPSNPNTIYIGSPNGGLWRSTDHGASWKSLSDFIPSIGISGIAIDPTNSNIIYISTGDEDGNNSSSNGIYKSIDGGVTWTALSYPYAGAIKSGEILINPKNPNMLWVVGTNGLYKTTDAGITWVNKRTALCKEIRLQPNNPNTLYVVERSGANANILKSTDAGETFTISTTFVSVGRTVIDVTPADSNYLYVLVANGDNSFKGIYRSIDAGLIYTAQNTTTDIFENNGYSSRQAYYDLAIAASDTDPNVIFTGCLDVWKSVDGGVNIYRANSWRRPDTPSYTHADIHDLKFYNHKLYAGTDGGIYISSDLGFNFTDKTINGLNISQFYRLDVAQSDSTQIVGGLQDNGGYSFANNAWVNFHGADGMDAAIDPSNPNTHYGFIQFGGSMYKHNISDTANGKFITSSPDGEFGNWITPLECGNGGTLYAGFKKLYILAIDNLLATSSFALSSNITQIRVSPTNDYRVLITNGSKLYISDGTASFTFSPLNSLPLKAISNFDFNRNDPNIIYAVGDLGIFKSVNSGLSWTDISYSNPSGSKNAIVHQASSKNNTIYLACNNAVYYTNDSLNDWQLYSNNLPNTTITDIEVNNVENHLLISTYGRGVWRTPVVPSSLAIGNVKQNSSIYTLYPNPVKTVARIKNAQLNEPAIVKISDASGAVVFLKEYDYIDSQTEFDCSALPNGIYIMTITSESHLISRKFIKE